MKQRGAAVVPETKAGRELDKELADMRKRKATVEDWLYISLLSVSTSCVFQIVSESSPRSNLS